MRLRPLAARLTATALLALTTTAAATLPASAEPAGGAGAPGTSTPAPYQLTLSTNPSTADFGHRTVNLTGTLSRADGSPVTDATVPVKEAVLYKTWNPWGDPIDPIERESRSLGTLRTDSNGHFTLDGVSADRWLTQNSTFVTPLNQVQFYASYDPPEDPTNQDIVFAETTVVTQPTAGTISYKVNKTRVHAGEILVVQGKVTWPAGHGPVAGTRVLLRTYFESSFNAQTTTDAQGNFIVTSKIRDYDNEFVIFSAPNDYYLAGASQNLPVKNLSNG
ncbi:acyl carrier protein [Streptomyces sp. NPDC058274]|uniref:acyl carrier protein n=1 Tax=Streptomyces sp. NPDC058274 TaxID=3346416 RepID=UPI0036ED569B